MENVMDKCSGINYRREPPYFSYTAPSMTREHDSSFITVPSLRGRRHTFGDFSGSCPLPAAANAREFALAAPGIPRKSI